MASDIRVPGGIRTPDLPLRSHTRLVAFMSFQCPKTPVSVRMFSMVECSYVRSKARFSVRNRWRTLARS